MNALIVHAHPEPASFNGAMLATLESALRDGGWCVDVSDLYAMRFDPVSDRRNFRGALDATRLRLQDEEVHASRHDGFVHELRVEMDKLARSDLLILQFPLWWLGLPAILKGWIDRVFACGVVYGGGRFFHTGVMRGRRALLVVTAGGALADYQASGRYGANMDAVLMPIERGVLAFAGYDVLPAHVIYAPARMDAAGRAAALQALRERAACLAGSPSAPSRGDPAATSRPASTVDRLARGPTFVEWHAGPH